MVPSKKPHFHDYPCCHGFPHCPTDSTKPGTVLVQPKEQSILGEQAFPLCSVDASDTFCRVGGLHERGQ